jgi:hypothetical protein
VDTQRCKYKWFGCILREGRGCVARNYHRSGLEEKALEQDKHEIKLKN